MRTRYWKSAGVATLAAALALVGTSPAEAVGATTVLDPSGVDYDPACLVSGGPPPAPNSIGSPGGSTCPGVSLYDGSTETTDLRRVVLEANATNQFQASFVLDGPVPAAGSTSLSAADLPTASFEGATYLALFQNLYKHTNTDNLTTGCWDASSTRIPDIHGSWLDGYHFFVGFEISFESGAWVHRAFAGEYDPSPGGGYQPILLGTDTGAGWVDADPLMVNGTNYSVVITGLGPVMITVTVDGVVRQTNTTCASPPGEFHLALAEPLDDIANVKGVSTADSSVVQPLVKAGQSFAGRTRGISDVTHGGSTAGQFNTNISHVAYTAGTLAPSDTLGPYTSCTSVAPCHMDDEFFNLPRGSTYLEYWDTPYALVF